MSAPSEMRELIAAIRANGYKVAQSGGGHKKVLDKSGKVVVDGNGPLILSGSPSEHRWREMHVNRLMKAGVLTKDPWKNRGEEDDGEAAAAKNGRTPQEEAEIERRRVEAQTRSDGLRGRTQTLRGRLEPIVAKLGGWSSGHAGVSQDDFAHVVMHWANSEGRTDLFPKVAVTDPPVSTTDVRRAVTNLRNMGATLSSKWHPLFTGFIDELEREAGDPPDPTEASLRYLELLREQKGVGPQRPPVTVGQPVQQGDRLEAYRRSSIPGVYRATSPVTLTPLAQDALFLMARGAGTQDQEKVMAVALEIADLENERRET